MSDPSTYWLNLTNAALGIVVLICCLAVCFGVAQEILARRKRAATLSGIDREVADLMNVYGDSHAFHLPELGVTMADGGEQLNDKEER